MAWMAEGSLLSVYNVRLTNVATKTLSEYSLRIRWRTTVDFGFYGRKSEQLPERSPKEFTRMHHLVHLRCLALIVVELDDAMWPSV